MKTEEAIAHFDGVAALARALNVSVAAIYQWGETIPLMRQYQIERITGGALIASDPDVPRADEREGSQTSNEAA